MPRPVPSCPAGPLRVGPGLDQFLLLHLKHWGWRAQGWPCFWPSCHQLSVMTSVKEFSFSQLLGREPQLLRRGSLGDVRPRNSIQGP